MVHLAASKRGFMENEAMSYRWGKINDGQAYTLVATDLLRAVASVGLGQVESVVFWRVWEETYAKTTRTDGTKAKPKPYRLSPQAMADEIGGKVTRQAVSRAMRNLVRECMLTETDDGLLINKQADQWLGLDRAGVQYAVDANSSRGGIVPEDRSAQVAVRSADVAEDRSAQVAEAKRTSCGSEAHALRSRSAQVAEVVVPPTPPIEEARASEDLRREEEKEERGEREIASPMISIENLKPPDSPQMRATHIAEAVAILSGSLETNPLAMALTRNAHTRDVIALEGWRFVVAARVHTSSKLPAHKRGVWPVFLRCAQNADPSELQDPPKQTRQDREQRYKPKETPYPYQYVNGPGSPGWQEQSA
jgi:hypothetical protein